jgi:hypothetical protein
MIAGAVTYDCSNSFLHQFQQLIKFARSHYSSFGIGKGFMCNGANLAYTKLLFEELNGFNGNDKTPVEMMSFLLQKQNARFPNKSSNNLQKRVNIIKTLDEWKFYFTNVGLPKRLLTKVVSENFWVLLF